MGKYAYKKDVREKVEIYFKDILDRYFPNNPILYIS